MSRNTSESAQNTHSNETDKRSLTESEKRRVLHKALIANRVEEKLLSMYSEGQLAGTVHTCIGQEMVGACVSEHLLTQDYVFSNHRCHGHFLSCRGNIDQLFAEFLGKRDGVCAGIGGSQHLCKDGFFSNGIQGGIVPVATGLAFANQMSASNGIAVVFIGDGTLGEGVLYESINLASKWQLPLLIIVENNGYAQSTCQQETLAGSIADRFEAFGVKVHQADTWDWENLYHSAAYVVDQVRERNQPMALIVDTFRLRAHSKGDDDRSPDLIQKYAEKDPLQTIISNQNHPHYDLLLSAEEEIEQALKVAERAPINQSLTLSENHLDIHFSQTSAPQQRVIKRINETFHSIMQEHRQVIFLGEDVRDPYGGAFKVSKGLSERYPERVLNTPISEAAIVGLGNGLALGGYLSFVEIMFGDFLGLAFDQIVNHAAKFEQMYAGQVRVDTVIRTPMGGYRGYGPTHSQSLEKHFLGVPGLTVLAINAISDPACVYQRLAKGGSGPVLLIENKTLYGKMICTEFPQGYVAMISDEIYPSIYVKPQCERIDVCIVAYGAMASIAVDVLEALFFHHDIVTAVLCPTQIWPFQLKRYQEVIANCKYLCVLEEGQGFSAFGAEVIAQFAELNYTTSYQDACPHNKSAHVCRLHAVEHCIPAATQLEEQVLPNKQDLIDKIIGLIKHA